MFLRTFGWSIAVAIAALAAAFLYGGPAALLLCAILGVLEVSLSFDNAVVNAAVLDRMSPFWQRIFLTIGILIAVFGMRFLFPLAVVWITAGLSPVKALDLALNPPPNHAHYFADGRPSYETYLTDAHPQIAAFGGMFLLMLFLSFVLDEREITWLSWLERPLARAGKLDQLRVVIAGVFLIVATAVFADDADRTTVLIAGIIGLISYITIDGLGSMFDVGDDDAVDDHEAAQRAPMSGPAAATKAVGKAAFFLFLYLEVLDASFSFDGVIGAFAITADPILIFLGLGFIGAVFVRSITIFLVRQGTLSEYIYLEHGAHWAIGALAVIMLVSIGVQINEIVTGLVGVVLIGAAFLTSVVRRRREQGADDVAPLPV